jgi:hypothetical protein
VHPRDEVAQSLHERKTHTLPRLEWSAAPDDSGGVWDEGRMPDSRDTAASASPDFQLYNRHDRWYYKQLKFQVKS